MIKITNGTISAQINEHGAELTALTAGASEIIWNGDAAYWTGHSPVLFPICGRLADDRYSENGKHYTLQKHGFARHSDFSVKDHSENSVTLSLTSDEKLRECYPFDFELDISFELTADSLVQTYTVRNRGNDTMYFSLGAHPAFNVPMGGKVLFGACEKPETLTVDGDGLINGTAPVQIDGNALTLTPHLFDNDAIIMESPKSTDVTVVSPNGTPLVKMVFDAVPYLLIWAKPDAPYVCIEPWHGVPDHSGCGGDISKKPAVVSLPAGNTFTFRTEIIPLS
ncbi:MAG: aldose 1-epimerase family protein [Clostridia bacterium]|nr:aldose 1-epimerase family protein [Clostridia bacterium]